MNPLVDMTIKVVLLVYDLFLVRYLHKARDCPQSDNNKMFNAVAMSVTLAGMFSLVMLLVSSAQTGSGMAAGFLVGNRSMNKTSGALVLVAMGVYGVYLLQYVGTTRGCAKEDSVGSVKFSDVAYYATAASVVACGVKLVSVLMQ
jgi:hypothetical protein